MKRWSQSAVLRELEARMVDALLDAARERRAGQPNSLSLATAAANHALTLADHHLFLTGDVDVPLVLPTRPTGPAPGAGTVPLGGYLGD